MIYSRNINVNKRRIRMFLWVRRCLNCFQAKDQELSKKKAKP